jgi:ribosome biogenesis GTPase
LIPGIDLKVVDIGDYKDKGKHTTTRRELHLMQDGGIIIDNPGIREIQLWEGSEGLTEAFPDVEVYFGLCKFSDCKHDSEPGCAIKDAIKKGELKQDRFDSYLKLQREIEYFQRKYDMKASQNEKKKWKKISAQAKEIVKFKYNKNK